MHLHVCNVEFPVLEQMNGTTYAVQPELYARLENVDDERIETRITG